MGETQNKIIKVGHNGYRDGACVCRLAQSHLNLSAPHQKRIIHFRACKKKGHCDVKKRNIMSKSKLAQQTVQCDICNNHCGLSRNQNHTRQSIDDDSNQPFFNVQLGYIVHAFLLTNIPLLMLTLRCSLEVLDCRHPLAFPQI